MKMLGKIFGRSAPRWRIHTNPDGTKGGMVSVSATVEDGAFIPVSAVVMSGVHVPKDAEITDGALVTGAGSVRFGPS